jgi:hypothetical protein
MNVLLHIEGIYQLDLLPEPCVLIFIPGLMVGQEVGIWIMDDDR